MTLELLNKIIATLLSSIFSEIFIIWEKSWWISQSLVCLPKLFSLLNDNCIGKINSKKNSGDPKCTFNLDWVVRERQGYPCWWFDMMMMTIFMTWTEPKCQWATDKIILNWMIPLNKQYCPCTSSNEPGI